MEDIEKTLYINELLSIYQELLSSTQQEILFDYFSNDFSISEIASNRNVSRAAVEDAIKKGIKKLEFYEEKLNICSKEKEIKEHIKSLKGKFDLKELEALERVVDK